LHIIAEGYKIDEKYRNCGNKIIMAKITIQKVVFGGKGLSKLEDGKTCFVPYVLPDEEVEIEINKDKKNFCEATPKNILKSNEYRKDPPCKYYTICGGCDFQHILYEYQLKLKKEALEETLNRIAKENIQIEKIIPSSSELFYRNKVQLKYDGEKLGFFKAESNEVVDIENCPITDEGINKAIDFLKNFLKNKNFIKEIHIYKSSTEKALVKFITEEYFELDFEDFKEKFPINLSAVAIYKKHKRLKTYGTPFVFEKVNQYTFRVSIDSFFQVNKYQIENFINEVLVEIPEDKSLTIGDLFCGVGTLSIPTAKKVKKVFGIEISKSAVKDAKYNARINSVNNVNFYEIVADKAGDFLFGFNSGILIFDPPRTGLSKKLIKKVLELKSLRKIIYVSCYPPTLARDITLLKEGGFKLEKLKMIDMFPQTHHIEAIAVLNKP